jgi:microcystin-dependent protein
MVDIPESAVWTPVIRLETTTPVRGGETGESNAPLEDLTNRTAFLKAEVEAVQAVLPTLAPIASPDFTGTPQAVTPPAGDESRKIVTTEWVFGVLRGITTKAVTGGVVDLTALEAGRGIIVLTGDLTSAATITIPAAAPGKWVVANRTNGAHPLGVRLNGSFEAPIDILPAGSIAVWSDGTDLHPADTESQDHALRGTPTASAPAATASTAQVATTAWARAFARGATTIDTTAGGTFTLTDAQANAPTLILTGTPAAAFAVVLPAEPGRWTIRNTAGQRADIRTGSQVTPHAIAAGRTQSVWTDGSVVRPDHTEARDLELPGAPAADTPAYDAAGREVVTAEWVRALLSGQTISTTGDLKLALKTVPEAGWLMLDGRSIGSAASGATARANADTAPLYTHLWTTFDNATCPVTGGRGADAASDFAADKALTLPDARGRALVMAGMGAGLTSRALAGAFGAETVAISLAQMPAHSHTGNTEAAGGHTHALTIDADGAHTHAGSTETAGAHAHTASTETAGQHQHYLSSEGTTAGNPDNVPATDAPRDWNFTGAGKGADVTVNAAGQHQHNITVQENGSHAHAVTVGSAGSHTHAGTAASAADHTHAIPVQGDGEAHPNVQPSFAVNLFVKL